MSPDAGAAGWPPIAELLPHGPPMLLLDRVIDHDAAGTRCAVEVGASPLFRDEAGRVPSWVALEYMAQCVAAHAGLQSRAQGEAPRIGFLIGSRKLRFHAASLGQAGLLEVNAAPRRGRMGLGAVAFECALREAGGGRLVAEGTVSIAIPPQPGAGAEGPGAGEAP